MGLSGLKSRYRQVHSFLEAPGDNVYTAFPASRSSLHSWPKARDHRPSLSHVRLSNTDFCPISTGPCGYTGPTRITQDI